MLEFNFINHSSFSIKKDKTILTVDPWIKGSVFNNSWRLLSSSPDNMINLIKNSNYVWFSHEHPDHFNPSNLNIFNNETFFLFQKTQDKRVIKFLKKISNKTMEVDSNDKINLCDNFSIKIFPFQDLDSYCLIQAEDLKILNLNDCDIKNQNELNKIKNKVGKIDILLAQFSYAIGKTNPEQNDQRKQLSKNILNKLDEIIKFFKPKYFIPFASFCYFSHNENFYLNDNVNKIDDTIEYLSKRNLDTKFLVFYPGDKWNFLDSIDNSIALKKYLIDYKKIKPDVLNIKKISITELIESSKMFIIKTKKNNDMFFLYNLINFKSYKIYFKVSNIDTCFKFTFNNGLEKIDDFNPTSAMCELSSDSLLQLFNSGYGYDALMIGGRFKSNKLGEIALNKIFKFQTKNYQNQFYNFTNILSKTYKKFSKLSRVDPER